MATYHAVIRASERAGVIFDPATVDSIVGTAEAFASKCSPAESVALRLRSVPMVGAAWSNVSNGDTLVAIIRHRTVVTIMFRRSSQPFHPANLSVDRCVSL